MRSEKGCGKVVEFAVIRLRIEEKKAFEQRTTEMTFRDQQKARKAYLRR
jgi:hypothetical protein